MGQFHFDPAAYLDDIRAEVASFDELQDAVAAATAGIEAAALLELGTGTGETARRVVARHPDARLLGIDACAGMLARAGEVVPGAELRVARLEEPLPDGPFDLVFSALAVHHLDAEGKRDLFRRVRAALRPGGIFVLGDVVVPDDPAHALTPLTPGFDLPDTAADQLDWLRDAGLAADLVWSRDDLAVIRAIAPPGLR